MTDLSPVLGLPYLQPAQAQKHVTHNEALRILDAVTQLGVLSADLGAPPAVPQDGDRYIVAAPASGDWAEKETFIAIFADMAWQFFAPRPGWRADVVPSGATLRFDGTAWQPAALPDTVPALGINASTDAENRLAVSSAATLLNHEGAGHQLKVNKAAASETASLLFQTGFSGRAEMGTTGSDDFVIKVSPDGSQFHTAASIDKDEGTMAVQGLASLKANGAGVSSVLFTPGGDGTISIYRMNAVSTAPARSATIASIALDTITLTAPVANQLFETIMEGVSYIRIWNMSRPVPESAWVKARPAANQLQVVEAAHIAGWTASDSLQVGDPSGHGMGGNVIALDVSPMQMNLFGQAFRQTGLICKAAMLNGSPQDSIDLTADGSGGSFIPCSLNGTSIGTTLVPTTVLSPVSNSNLVGLREKIAGTADIRLVSVIAMLV